MRKLFLLFLFLLSVSLTHAQSNQSRTITGTVSDQDGEALIGVTVVIKGTTIGVISDVSGNYSIDVPEGVETLIFS